MSKKKTEDKKYSSPEEWILKNFPNSYEEEIKDDYNEYPFESDKKSGSKTLRERLSELI